MNTLKQIGFFLWSVLLFIGGLFTYAKFLDKPETVVNNEFKKVKNKGQNNDISTSSNTTVTNDNDNVKNKRKFRLFRKRKN